MKKQVMWIKVLACLMALVFVTGCASKPAATNETEPTEQKQAGTQANNSAPGKVWKVAYVSAYAIDELQWLTDMVAGLNTYGEEHDNIEMKIVEAVNANEYEPKIRALAEGGYDIIITRFNGHADATKAVAKDFPDIYFGIIDAKIQDIADYPNLQEFGIDRGYNSFLAGATAAYMSKSNKVAFIGGADIEAVNQIIAAWQQGLQYVNPDIEDTVAYSDTFVDPTIGRELALSLLSKGCDVIGASTGGAEAGVCQAIAESPTDAYYAAYDVHYYDILKGRELGSAVSYLDKMVIMFIEDVTAGKFEGGILKFFGPEMGTVAYEFAKDTPVPEDIQKKVMEISDKILNGEIEIGLEPLHK